MFLYINSSICFDPKCICCITIKYFKKAKLKVLKRNSIPVLVYSFLIEIHLIMPFSKPKHIMRSASHVLLLQCTAREIFFYLLILRCAIRMLMVLSLLVWVCCWLLHVLLRLCLRRICRICVRCRITCMSV